MGVKLKDGKFVAWFPELYGIARWRWSKVTAYNIMRSMWFSS